MIAYGNPGTGYKNKNTQPEYIPPVKTPEELKKEQRAKNKLMRLEYGRKPRGRKKGCGIKPIIIDGVLYQSRGEAANAIGVTITALSNHLRKHGCDGTYYGHEIIIPR